MLAISFGGSAQLIVSQRVDGIEGGGFFGGVEAEEDADGAGKKKRF
jgi:hypothetical protein